jgi:hypothetical protein
MESLTRPALRDLLRHDPKDRDHLDHDLDDDVYHSRRWSNVDVLLKPIKKEFHAAEQVCKNLFDSADILDSLRGGVCQ